MGGTNEVNNIQSIDKDTNTTYNQDPHEDAVGNDDTRNIEKENEEDISENMNFNVNTLTNNNSSNITQPDNSSDTSNEKEQIRDSPPKYNDNGDNIDTEESCKINKVTEIAIVDKCEGIFRQLLNKIGDQRKQPNNFLINSNSVYNAFVEGAKSIGEAVGDVITTGNNERFNQLIQTTKNNFVSSISEKGSKVLQNKIQFSEIDILDINSAFNKMVSTSTLKEVNYDKFIKTYNNESIEVLKQINHAYDKSSNVIKDSEKSSQKSNPIQKVSEILSTTLPKFSLNTNSKISPLPNESLPNTAFKQNTQESDSDLRKSENSDVFKIADNKKSMSVNVDKSKEYKETDSENPNNVFLLDDVELDVSTSTQKSEQEEKIEKDTKEDDNDESRYYFYNTNF
jgi:hypothetical protein